jgi:hypothetical protein
MCASFLEEIFLTLFSFMLSMVRSVPDEVVRRRRQFSSKDGFQADDNSVVFVQAELQGLKGTAQCKIG